MNNQTDLKEKTDDELPKDSKKNSFFYFVLFIVGFAATLMIENLIVSLTKR